MALILGKHWYWTSYFNILGRPLPYGQW
jgi:hypothetical protein